MYPNGDPRFEGAAVGHRSHRKAAFLLLSSGILELGIDTSRRYSHDDCLCGTDLLIGDMVFLSIAKAVVHSWVAPKRHRNGQVDQTGGFGIQNFVLSDAGGKGLKGLILFFGQHVFSFHLVCFTRMLTTCKIRD